MCALMWVSRPSGSIDQNQPWPDSSKLFISRSASVGSAERAPELLRLIEGGSPSAFEPPSRDFGAFLPKPQTYACVIRKPDRHSRDSAAPLAQAGLSERSLI